jgi:hypothetical protein
MARIVSLRSTSRTVKIRVRNTSGTLVSLRPDSDTLVDVDLPENRAALGHHGAIGQYNVFPDTQATLDARYAAFGSTAPAVDALLSSSKSLGFVPLLPAPPVTDGVSWGINLLSNGTDTSETTNRWVWACDDLSGVWLVYTLAYDFETALVPNDVTVKAGIGLTANGQPTNAWASRVPAYFGGQREVVLSPAAVGATTQTGTGGPTVVSDMIPIEVAAGTGFHVFTRPLVAAGGKWPLGKFLRNGTTETFDGRTANVDVVDSGTAPTSTFDKGYTPVAVLGRRKTKGRSFVFFGDSIGAGMATSPLYSDNQAGGGLARAFSKKAGYINLCQGAEQAAHFLTVTKRQARQRIWAGAVTDAVQQYVNNDVHLGGASFASVALLLQQMWTLVDKYGSPRLTQLTCTGRTTSSDNWTTIAGQTAHANNSVRIAINQWLRAGAPQDSNGLAVAPGTAGAVVNPLLAKGYAGAGMVAAGVVDWLTGIESATDSGLWNVSTGQLTTTSGSTAATLVSTSSVTGFCQSQNIAGSGLTAGTTISSFTGGALMTPQTSGALTLSAVATSTGTFTVTGALTGDGTHPNQAAASVMAANIPATGLVLP